ncbi:MAG: DUF2256 and DUF3253 domain-containing protein [Planctomycetes bacterium]|nr:DUF2256 and DUF3253 domain-containing protein [Planctomycetota bacterium]
MRGAPSAKVCAVCGRTFAWRRRWERCWSSVRHCSRACAARRRGDVDRACEAAILGLLAQRTAAATICPSEAARVVWPVGWQQGLQRLLAAARRLGARGAIDVLQRGRVVDPSQARGAVRLRRRPDGRG